jgi:hypothetical protein
MAGYSDWARRSATLPIAAAISIGAAQIAGIASAAPAFATSDGTPRRGR